MSVEQLSDADYIEEAEIFAVSEWLMQQGLDSLRVRDLVHAFCHRLRQTGFPLLRLYVGLRALHPLYSGYGYVWDKEREVTVENTYLRSADTSRKWRESPFHYMAEQNMRELRVRLDRPGAQNFPIFDDLRALGGSDYLAMQIRFSRTPEWTTIAAGDGMILSFATDRPGGFSSADLNALRILIPSLSLALKALATERLAQSVVETYLGRDAGRRVLTGQVARGEVTRLNAAILFADLRGFTALADSLPDEEIVPMLDEYLDCIAGPVLENQGEVLKFMGDGLLATFDVADTHNNFACATALEASVAIFRRIDALNAQRRAADLPCLELDLALHMGEVLYGNVGSETRLDFTVIGPAVNEAARIEALCKDLGHRFLISSAFHDGAGKCRNHMKSIGKHALRGVRRETQLFVLDKFC